MAEGGEGEEPKENPFSFHNFLHQDKKTKPEKNNKDKIEEDDDFLFNLPDVSGPGKKKGPSLIVTDDKPEQGKQKKKKSGDENPFSFKKFLESASTKPKYSGNGSVNHSRTNQTSHRNTPDFANDLPDFVQDHFGDLNRERSSSRDVELPDFALPVGNVSGHTGSPIPRRDSSGDLFSGDVNGPSDLVLDSSQPDLHMGNDRSTDSLSDDFDRGPENKSHVPTSLPDFLSDGIFNNTDNCDSDYSHLHNGPVIHGASSNREGVAAFEINGDLELELRRLRDENHQLRLQLEEAKREAVTETQRCHKMKKEMEVLQKKEAEDTAALERMVQQVEANLITTTERAVQAENTVSRLQNEVKSLKSNLTAARAENATLQSDDKGMSDLRERTKYASEQLSTAATTAEQNLKQLLSGVDQLKILAQVLSTFDKITDHESENKEEQQKHKRKHDKHKPDKQQHSGEDT